MLKILKTPHIFIRVDGNENIGLGHLIRCITIAEMFIEVGLKVHFLCGQISNLGKTLIKDLQFSYTQLQSVGINANSAKEVANIIGAETNSKLLVDLPFKKNDDAKNFGEFFKNIKSYGITLAVIDGLDSDCASMNIELPTDLIIVPYLNAENRSYNVLQNTHILAGIQYFPFSGEIIRQARKKKRVATSAKKVLICFGGGKVKKENRKILDGIALCKKDDWEITIIGEVEHTQFLGQNYVNLNHAKNLPKIMFESDIAILGSGLIRYEAALLGTPSLVFSRNKNHARLVQEFADSELCVHGGIINDLPESKIANSILAIRGDLELRKKIASRRHKLNKSGTKKIVKAILEMPNGVKV